MKLKAPAAGITRTWWVVLAFGVAVGLDGGARVKVAVEVPCAVGAADRAALCVLLPVPPGNEKFATAGSETPVGRLEAVMVKLPVVLLPCVLKLS
jgi:hypothetical protein